MFGHLGTCCTPMAWTKLLSDGDGKRQRKGLQFANLLESTILARQSLTTARWRLNVS